MKNYLLALFVIIMAASCTKYSINGSSDMQGLDGRMLYLKGVIGGEFRSIDSCDVVHGKFALSGSLDSVRVVTLAMDETPIIPVVLEQGSIEVVLNEQRQYAKGTPLNDTLASFNKQYEEIVMQLQDLQHQQSQAIMNGDNVDSLNVILAAKQQAIMAQEDKLVSGFIIGNFDNCLGSYVFQLATSAYQYPMLTPWIEALMTKATDTFKNDPYVKEYMEVAHQNQEIMTGMAEPAQMVDQPSSIPEPTPNVGDVLKDDQQPPTPNEMAK